MNHTARRRRWSLPFVLTAGLLACNTQTAVDPAGSGAGEAAKPVEVAKPRPVEPLPQLRAGTRALVAGPTLSGKVVATGADTTHEYLELTLPATGDAASLDFDRTHVELTGAAPGDIAVVTTGMGGTEVRIVVRRKLGGGEEVAGALFGERWDAPVFLCPVGSQRCFHPDGELASAQQALRQDLESTELLQLLRRIIPSSEPELDLAAVVREGVDFVAPQCAGVSVTCGALQSISVRGRSGQIEYEAALSNDDSARSGALSNRVIGGAIVGTNGGELLGEIGLAIEMGADAEDIALTIHAHPTLHESVGLAAEVFEGSITDLPNAKAKKKK